MKQQTIGSEFSSIELKALKDLGLPEEEINIIRYIREKQEARKKWDYQSNLAASS